jgi:hypothetical protein
MNQASKILSSKIQTLVPQFKKEELEKYVLYYLIWRDCGLEDAYLFFSTSLAARRGDLPICSRFPMAGAAERPD